MTNPIRKYNYIYILILLFFIQGCGTTRVPRDYLTTHDYSTTKVYKAPYKSIETELTNIIDITYITPRDRTDYDPDLGFSYTDLKYKDLDTFLLSSKSYRENDQQITVVVYKKPRYFASEDIPGKKLVVNYDYNTCNIWCTGYRGLLFNIEKLTKDTTSVKVNYYDYVYPYLFFPTIKKGYDEEQHIHKLLFNSYEIIQQ